MTNSPLVSIIILNWNSSEDTIRCLESLKNISYLNYEVFVLDNGSSDDSLSKIHKWANRKGRKILTKSAAEFNLLKVNEFKGYDFTFILNEINTGFTGGNNLVVKKLLSISRSSYILLLNSDTIVTKSFLTNLVRVCQKDKKIGSAQSVLIRFDKKTIDSLGIEMSGCRVFDSRGGWSVSTLQDLEDCREIFGSCGATALYRADLIKRIGLFDEGLFATFEDFDLAWRIRLEGYKSVLVKNSVVYHRGGVSRVRGDHVIFDMRSYLGAKNPLVMFNRYYPISFKIIASLSVNFAVAVISAVKNHRVTELISIMLGFPADRRKIGKNKLLKNVQREWIK
jgi:hypothetical protein